MILRVCFVTKTELKYFEILSQLWLTKRKTRDLYHSYLFVTSSVTSKVCERKTLSWFELCNDWVYKSKNHEMTWYLKATGDNSLYFSSHSWFRDRYYFYHTPSADCQSFPRNLAVIFFVSINEHSYRYQEPYKSNYSETGSFSARFLQTCLLLLCVEWETVSILHKFQWGFFKI